MTSPWQWIPSNLIDLDKRKADADAWLKEQRTKLVQPWIEQQRKFLADSIERAKQTEAWANEQKQKMGEGVESALEQGDKLAPVAKTMQEAAPTAALMSNPFTAPLGIAQLAEEPINKPIREQVFDPALQWSNRNVTVPLVESQLGPQLRGEQGLGETILQAAVGPLGTVVGRLGSEAIQKGGGPAIEGAQQRWANTPEPFPGVKGAAEMVYDPINLLPIPGAKAAETVQRGVRAAREALPEVGNVARRLATEQTGGGKLERFVGKGRTYEDALTQPDTREAARVAATSLNQVPSMFKRVQWEQGDVNLDLGGGRFNTASDFLRAKGVKNLVLDPYNRPIEHNQAVLTQIAERPADTVTVANVLNVIQEPIIRKNVIAGAGKYVKPDGRIYFSVYEGDGKGIGRTTGMGTWQENRSVSTYLDEIKSIYPDAHIERGYIVATLQGAKLPDQLGSMQIGTALDLGGGAVGAGSQYDPNASPEENAKRMAIGAVAGAGLTYGARKGLMGLGIEDVSKGKISAKPAVSPPESVAAGAAQKQPWEKRRREYEQTGTIILPDDSPLIIASDKAATELRAAEKAVMAEAPQWKHTPMSVDVKKTTVGAAFGDLPQTLATALRSSKVSKATRQRYLQAKANYDNAGNAVEDAVRHETLVRQALSEGKPVPPEVLADYPDLAAKAKLGEIQPVAGPEAAATSDIPSTLAKPLESAVDAPQEGISPTVEAEMQRIQNEAEAIAEGQAAIKRGAMVYQADLKTEVAAATGRSKQKLYDMPYAEWEKVRGEYLAAKRGAPIPANAAPTPAEALPPQLAPEVGTTTQSPVYDRGSAQQTLETQTLVPEQIGDLESPPSRSIGRESSASQTPPPNSIPPIEQGGPSEPAPIEASITAPRTAGFQQFWDRARNVIASQGPAGRELSGLLRKTRDIAETTAGGWVSRLPTVRKLNTADFTNFVDAAEGNAQARTPLIQQAVNEWGRVREDIYGAAQNAMLDVGYLTDYFPHTYDPKMFQGDNWVKAVRHLVQTGQAANTDEAAQMLRYAQDVIRNRRQGNLEISRTVDLPNYEKTKQALFRYIESAANRIAQVRMLGQDDSIALRLINKIGVEGGDASAAKNLFDISVGAKKYGEIQKEISSGLRAYNVITKLGLGAVTNLGQTLNTLTVAGALRTLANIPKAALSEEAGMEALKAGTILDGTLHNLREGGGWEGTLGKIGAPGFNIVERFNRVLAGEAGKSYAADMAQQAAKGSEGALKALQTMGLDAQAIANRGGVLNKAEQIQAARNMVERTQFKVDPQDLPGWASSPAGKVVMQFRTFSYNQSAFIGREIIQPALKGDVRPLLRFLVFGLPIGVVGVETTNFLRNRNSEENPTKRIIQYYQKVGGLGILGDLMTGLNPMNANRLDPARYATMGAGSIGGPTVSTVIEGLGALPGALNENKSGERNFKNLERFGLKQIPVVGPTLQNTLVPYSPRGASGLTPLEKRLQGAGAGGLTPLEKRLKGGGGSSGMTPLEKRLQAGGR